MKKFTLLASLLMFVMLSYAANVIPVETAMRASKNFLAERVGATKAGQMELVLEKTEYSTDGVPVTYRFRVGEKGFIIVSATELANPVLAFSLESDYNAKSGAEIYNEMYTKSLAHLINNPSAALTTRNSWDHYLASDFQPYNHRGNPCVQPLVTTTWTQERFYNTKCPTNPLALYNEDGRAVVGCVALTMANILFYYRYPEHGTGVVSYIPREYDHETHDLIYTYPAQVVNYADATYDYNAIANSLGDYDGELAKLIYHCGVSVRMSYGTIANEGSGSQSEYALNALQTNYFYSDEGQYQLMSEEVFADSLVYLWVNKAKAELDAHRPLFYSGHSTSGGHAWIVDGYTTIGNATYFHVNWGWAGSGNGYFLINNQNSNQGAFTLENAMMVKLMPDSAAIEKPAESSARVTSSFGTISDGAGNMKYAPNSNRRWVIACPDATAYKFQFSKLKVKSGDEVIIYKGATEASGVKERYSGDYLMAACNDYSGVPGGEQADYVGQALPGAVTVNADSVLVVFTSNADNNVDYGFVLDYEVTNYSKGTCQSSAEYTDQTAVLTDKPSNSTSDEEYRASSICEYNLKLQYCDKLVYVFHKFDLKDGDFVDIYNQTAADPDSRVLVAHYDADNQPTIGQVLEYDAPLVSAGGRVRALYTIRFASDNKLQGNGFQFTYYGIQTGLNNYENVEVNVYPNPASSYVNVQVSTEDAQQFSAKVVDMMGKTVYMDQFNHNGGEEIYQIPVNNLSKGVYFLHLNSSNGSTVQKFIVQ